MKDSHLLAHHIRLLNGRIFQKLLSQDPEALYRSEQGKILAVLWNSETGCATATDIALATGLANNTLTTMIKKLEEQKLVIVSPCGKDKRKKYLVLTELGKSHRVGAGPKRSGGSSQSEIGYDFLQRIFRGRNSSV